MRQISDSIQLFRLSISERKIFKFRTKKIQSNTPHFFIHIKMVEDSTLIMMCCTSQLDTISRFIEKNKLNLQTIVNIPPNPPFTKDTFVNCNGVIKFTLDEIKEMHGKELLTISGEISIFIYNQIIRGLLLSPLIENELKDTLSEIYSNNKFPSCPN